ncbi:MAG: AMP-binding protein [Acidimicrobiales bacterium]
MSEPIHWSAHLPEGTAAEDVDLTARISLPAAWSSLWAANPAARVLGGPDGIWVTGAGLLETTAAVAGRLVAAGAHRGDRVLFAAPTSRPLVIAHCAAMRAGLVVVPVNPAASRRELDAAIAAANPKVAVLGTEELRKWASKADPRLVVTGPEVSLAEGPRPPLDAVRRSDPAMVVYTSGTTGSPKGVELSHANLLAGAESVRIAWRWTARDRLLLALPLCHIHGLGIGLHGGLLSGGSVLLFERFDPETVLAAAADGATMFFGVPTMYERLAAADRGMRLARLRLCVSGSAALNAQTHRSIEWRCGQRVLERYGTTETLLLVSNPLDGERRAGTVGFPLPGVELRLDEKTREILVRGPSVFAGYRELPETNAAAFTDGWFRTGDIGEIDDGYLRIVGRAKELIITGGYNVYPREVEDVLRSFPGVLDAAVVGTPSAEWGETVTAFVEAPPTIDLEALSEHARGELAPYKRPRLLYRRDELPRNLLGKVVKERLGADEP